NPVGVSRKGAPLEGIDSASRSVHHLSACFNGLSTGIDDLTRGELKFYQGDIFGAETLLTNVLTKTRIHFNKGFEFAHRALLYTMRIAVFQGDHQKAEKALKETKMQLDEIDYNNRYFNYDISLAWYYYMMDSPKMIPGWIQENFSPYGHASFNENFGNQMKARYHYKTRNYPPLLSYIQEMRKRESYLYGRVEMLVIEACIHYKMKDRKKACSVLAEAYETAAPNDLLMPFIELGKDMRTLTAYVLKERIPKYAIPKTWLEYVNRKAASYAKHHGFVIAKYRQASGMSNDFIISPREKDILVDLSRGLSRTEIAANRNLSINTIKMVINNVYSKLGAESLADAIRVAIERKII
ncbi:MAG: LuxR C-terminal-related transcriptional regulator, partial [Treponema sp.]|nr:LuxR C-terminal-related transcriptional regulator [Treponema sp.]